MNDLPVRVGNNHILQRVWRKICSYFKEKPAGKTGARPIFSVAVGSRRKLLKIERLQLGHFGAEVPSFRQAMDWRK
jgi:hypothetical protein